MLRARRRLRRAEAKRQSSLEAVETTGTPSLEGPVPRVPVHTFGFHGRSNIRLGQSEKEDGVYVVSELRGGTGGLELL